MARGLKAVIFYLKKVNNGDQFFHVQEIHGRIYKRLNENNISVQIMISLGFLGSACEPPNNSFLTRPFSVLYYHHLFLSC